MYAVQARKHIASLRRARPDKIVASSSKRLASKFYQL
jgi:hypothetical protein